MTDTDRYRLVVLGAGRVGKTCILRKFVQNSFSDRYRETCEDIHTRDFRIRGRVLPLDMVDTNFGYPDMRRLSIISAHAFIIVFAVDDVASFKNASDLLEEICTRRSDAKTLPLVIVGNKCDLDNKKINEETAYAFVNRVVGSRINSVKYLETSAKTGQNVREIFTTLLSMSGFGSNDHSAVSQTVSLAVPSARSASEHRRTASFRGTRVTTNNEETVSGKARSPRCQTKKEGHDKLTRHGSLMRKTNRFSLKHKQTRVDEPDESDCKIS